MQRQTSLSITLPRNFEFHYQDNALPVTPMPQFIEEQDEVNEPPPPPKQTFKVRRRKAEAAPRDIILDIEADALPTFEMTAADAADFSPLSDSDMHPQYLAPRAVRLPLLSPPRTPVSQMTDYTLDNKHTDWTSVFQSKNTERPDTAFSDSSVSSCGSNSLKSYPSFGSLGAGGSCTSPDSDNNDVFYADGKDGRPVFSPELLASPSAKRKKTLQDLKWTPDMDNHLWFTYLKYLQDPELTPFKMLPGTAPPLGVCGRVAREAKHSWKTQRTPVPHLPIPYMPSIECTATESDRAKTWSHWPSTESGTRRRLRKLCKKTPSLSAHYQRLLRTRSPSPFQSSSSPATRSDSQATTCLAPSSVALPSSAPPVQSEDPFADFSSKPFPAVRKPDTWYGRVGRSQAHQKSHSLQWAIGRDKPLDLASPFNEAGSHINHLPFSNRTQTLGRQSLMPPPDGLPSLHSPLKLHAPRPASRSLKRRFGILDESSDNIVRMEALLPVDPSAAINRHTPRDRAFSLDAVFDTTRSLSMSFERNPPAAPAGLAEGDITPQHSAVKQQDSAVRLGSPFAVPSSAGFNTFPRRINALSSDLFDKDGRYNLSLEGKFRKLAAENIRHCDDMDLTEETS